MKKLGLMALNLQFFAEESDSAPEVGVNETESAEQSTDTAESTETETTSGTEEVAEPQPQSKETNAAFANMRRELEAARRQQQELDAEYARQYGKYTNPETGQPIRSAKDYFDAMAAQERMNARAKMQENGIDPSVIDNMINNSPAVRQAQAATAELNNYRAQQMMEEDFRSVMTIDPTKSSAEDIINDPSYAQVVDYVRNVPGIRFSDAYKIVNFDRLSATNSAAAKQAAINQVKGKSHLSTGASVDVSSAEEDIPASLHSHFKDIFPDKSEKELKALYNKTLVNRR